MGGVGGGTNNTLEAEAVDRTYEESAQSFW